MKPHILIADDDLTFGRILTTFLTSEGFEITLANSVKEARDKLGIQDFQLMLLDYRLPDGNGLDILAAAKAISADVPAIIMTSFNDIRTAVKAMQMGAKNYILKPINPEELLMQVMETLQRKSNSIHPKSQLGNIVIGKSEASTILHNQIKLIAATELSVIIEGESGTGKENIARQIHQQSARANKPFVAVDCGTLSANLAGSELFGHVKGAFTGAIINKKGSMEMAQGGTLFLDEIGNLSYEVQVKLLRVIQERTMLPVGGTKSIDLDIRILVATNDVLKQSFKNGSFREDLYHRLNEFKIEVPALRNRQEDFPIFIAAFLEDANVASNKQVSGLSDELFQILTQYDWPGNIRELKNIIRRLVLLTPSGLAQKESLPSEMLSDLAHKTSERQLNLKENQTELEKELIEKTLLEVKFNKTKAAKLLNIDRSTLYAKMEKYNIQ